MTVRGRLASSVASSPLLPDRARVRLLRWLGCTVGARASINSGLTFLGAPNSVSIGEDAFVNADAMFGAGARIRIGNGVAIGPSARFLPTTHEVGPSSARAGTTQAAEINVGDGAWLGASVTILGGVSIGRGTIVAAGAVVQSDCEPDSLYGGVPARLIRSL